MAKSRSQKSLSNIKQSRVQGISVRKGILSISAVALVAVIAVSIAIPVLAATNLNPNKLYGAPSYVLNLIGKKDGWSGGGTYDNPERHTMFLPQTTAENVTVWMSQGTEFAV